MEQAIVQTLKFIDTPLKAYQIHKWLSKKAKLRQVEGVLIKMYKDGKVGYKDGRYFLKKQVDGSWYLVDGGLGWQDKIRVQRLKQNPGVRLISSDGKDLFIINGSKSLAIKQHSRDSAFNLLKMKILWQKDRTYFKLLEENAWVFKYFPNWTTALY